MFKIFITISMILASVSAFAGPVKTETLYTCEEDDGDQWLEVGIVMNDGPGFRALVVAHNDDDGSAKLIASRQVFASKKGDAQIFEDDGTIRLVVDRQARSFLVGTLSVLQDGSASISEVKLICREKSEISFQK